MASSALYLAGAAGRQVQTDELPLEGVMTSPLNSPVPGASTLARLMASGSARKTAIDSPELVATIAHVDAVTGLADESKPLVSHGSDHGFHAPVSEERLDELEALAKVRSFEIDRMKAAMEDTGSTAANLTISARSPPQAASASRRRNSLTGTSPARRASITGSTAGGSVANTALLAHLSPKDVDAFLRGDALPSESKGDFLMAGRGVGGGRRGSFASPPPVPESATEGEGPVSGERRRSIAEVHYGHIGPKVETRRASVVAGSTAAPDTEAPASPPKPLLKAGVGHGGGVKAAASMYGFKGNYGAKFGKTDEPGGSRIWMPGNIDLPADLGIFVNEGEELEEQVAQDSLASRQPSVEYLAYAERMRSLRLRDGGGLVEMLGINLDDVTDALHEAQESKGTNSPSTLGRKQLHLIITGPAFGLDFGKVELVEGQSEEEKTEAARWSQTVVHYVSPFSPFSAVIQPGDPLYAIDGQPVGHLDFEHAWQRILKIGARASEVDAHTITLLVAPEAIARGKVIMKAELEHTRREEILATFSAGGMAGLDKQTVNVHDDRHVAAKSLVKQPRPRWKNCRKVETGVFSPPAGTDAAVAAATIGSPEWKSQKEIEELQAVMRQRRTSYADISGFRGAADTVFGAPMLSASRTGTVTGNGLGSPLAPLSPMPQPTSVVGSTPTMSFTGRATFTTAPGRVEFNPTVFAPVTVQIDDNTVASCRATRSGYMIDVTFTTQPVGILLKGLEVQSTLAGSAADGVVAAGDQLVRVGIHDVRHWAAGKGPKPMEVLVEAVKGISAYNPLHLRFLRTSAVVPSAEGPLTGIPSWAAEALAGHYPAASVGTALPETPVPVAATASAPEGTPRETGSTPRIPAPATVNGSASMAGTPRQPVDAGKAIARTPQSDVAARIHADVATLRALQTGRADASSAWSPEPRLTSRCAVVTVRALPLEVRLKLEADDDAIKAQNEAAGAAEAARIGGAAALDAVLPRDTDFRTQPSHDEDVLVEVAFTGKPFGVLLAAGNTVAGVVNGTQAADALQAGDEIVGLGGLYAWSAEVRKGGGVAAMLTSSSADVSPDKPYTISFLRRGAGKMPVYNPTVHSFPDEMPRTHIASGATRSALPDISAPAMQAAAGTTTTTSTSTSAAEETREPVTTAVQPRVLASRPLPTPEPAPAAPQTDVPSVVLDSSESEASEIVEADSSPCRKESPQRQALPLAEVSGSSVEGGETGSSSGAGAVPRPLANRDTHVPELTVSDGVLEGSGGVTSTDGVAGTGSGATGTPALPASQVSPRSPRPDAERRDIFEVEFKTFPFNVRFATKTGTGVFASEVKRETYASEFIKQGDWLIKFNDTDVSKWSLDEVERLLAEPENSPATFAPQRMVFERRTPYTVVLG